MSFLGGASSSQSAGVNPDQAIRKQQLMEQVRGEMAFAQAQGLIDKINDKCYLKCVTKPSNSLTTWEQGCLGNCMDRYMEAFNIVSRTYTARLSQEAEGLRSSS